MLDLNLWQTLFGRVSPQAADRIIRKVVIGWYAFAAWQILVHTIYMLVAGRFSGYVIDGAVLAIGAYFLGARNSRSVALALFGYSLITVVTMLAEHSVRPLVFVAVVLGWCGVRATWIRHRSGGFRTAWKRAIAISSLASVASLVAVVGVAVLLAFTSVDPEGDLASELFFAALVLALTVVMAPLSRRYPFAGHDQHSVAALAQAFD
jgi:hypothetical protein